MKKRRRIRLKYKKDRVLLSDVLPYELPIIMSNRSLYRFCVKNKVRYDFTSNILYWNDNIDDASFEVLKMLFRPAFDPKKSQPLPSAGKTNLTKYSTSPFIFRILHKDTDFRSLSVIHPAMQIGMVDFYNQFKSLIIHYCTRSSYSLRHPQKVASFFYYKDRLHDNLLGTKKDKIELFFNEYENLKTFFSYRKYTQIHKFYDDYRFQRAEKRFARLMRFDIQKCFDSIYTHSIAWATQGGKFNYKRTFNSKDSSSFGGIFDTVIQRLNYNETNGIVIGPEFSRIFAEIILQHVDRSVEHQLEQDGIKHGADYQLYRYVDDYFLFYNDDKVKDRIRELLNLNLEEYRFKIGNEKTKEYTRPFLTEISQAKIRIDRLISDLWKYRSSETIKEDVVSGDDDEDEKDKIDKATDSENKEFSPESEKLEKILQSDGYYPLRALKFNSEYKDILISVGVNAKDVLNYTLSCITTRIERELKKFDKQYRYLKLTTLSKGGVSEELRNRCSDRLKSMERQLTRYLSEAIESSFFIFALNRRITSTLKLTQLLNSLIIYLCGDLKWNGKTICKRFAKDITKTIFSHIQNEVIDIFKQSKCHEYAQLEILYLLIIMRDIDSIYSIPADILKEWIGLSDKGRINPLNTIAINVILYYIGNKRIYEDLKTMIIDHILITIKQKDLPDFHKDAESIIFLLDLACCPYVDRAKKIMIMKVIGLSDDEITNLLDFGNNQKYFFTKWGKVDITKELAAKLSQEVYS